MCKPCGVKVSACYETNGLPDCSHGEVDAHRSACKYCPAGRG